MVLTLAELVKKEMSNCDKVKKEIKIGQDGGICGQTDYFFLNK